MEFLTKKYGGIPGYVILIGVGGLAYLYFKSKSSAPATSTDQQGQGGQPFRSRQSGRRRGM